MHVFANMSTSEQDALVTRAIETLTAALSAPAVRCRHVCAKVGVSPSGDAMRAVDRSLQRLRRKGVIAYDSALGWQLTGRSA